MSNERDLFNTVAADYHAMRPSYPPGLFADLASALQAHHVRVLEVGCGSGQATRGFLKRGWTVVAVDPGAELIALAQASLTGTVRFHVAHFEAFDPEPGSFDLVASAQAWHWIDPEVSFPRAAKALRAGGSLAVFGHVPITPPEVAERLEPVFAEIAPQLWGPPPETWYLPQGPVPALFNASALFGPVAHEGYTWTENGSAETFVGQMRTRSYFNALETARRDQLFARVEEALAPLGELQFLNETHLYRAALRG